MYKGQAFDRMAGFYDLMMRLAFGRAIVRSQTVFLDRIPPRAKVLIIGGGTGWINEAILKCAPEALIDYLEISPKMLQQARHKADKRKFNQIRWIQGDEKRIAEFAPYDVVVSNFFLDLFAAERSKRICASFYEYLREGGLCIYTDFYAENSRVGLRKLGINLMYLIADQLSLVEAKRYWNYEKSFENLPFVKIEEKFFFAKMIHSLLYRKV